MHYGFRKLYFLKKIIKIRRLTWFPCFHLVVCGFHHIFSSVNSLWMFEPYLWVRVRSLEIACCYWHATLNILHLYLYLYVHISISTSTSISIYLYLCLYLYLTNKNLVIESIHMHINCSSSYIRACILKWRTNTIHTLFSPAHQRKGIWSSSHGGGQEDTHHSPGCCDPVFNISMLRSRPKLYGTPWLPSLFFFLRLMSNCFN
jgi:hypothetical protein